MASAGTQGISEQPPDLKALPSERMPTEALTSPSSNLNTVPRYIQPGFIARLQAAFFPPSLPHNALTLQEPINSPKPILPKYIKTRIITWNMHDSLPKGNLEELLGTVPLYTPRNIHSDAERLAIPGLSLDDSHPYHILVIAGQECPTLSGIPMGIAANFKHWDPRERDKEKYKLDATLEDADSKTDSKAKHKSLDRKILQRAESLLHKHKHMKHDHTGHSKPDDASEEATAHSPTTSGWSAVLEDWYANGMGSLHGLKPVVTATGFDSPNSSEAQTPVNGEPPNVDISARPGVERPVTRGTIDVNWTKESSNKDAITTHADSKKGPYELLIKERLMGIYMAIYVHRDVRPLIRGVSSDTVPAGLIGGRLGNKGGVGISVNFDGTSLLFINAHLAAHEGKAQLRVANLSKIKTELALDSFLAPDDPRTVSEDLTDKFDHTFIFGDLNFRLDISRLHADWLISRKEYNKALGFDQLKRLMDKDPTFVNFREGEINFPPTFKYDVLPRKKSSRKLRKPSLEEEPEDVERESRKSISSRRVEDNEEMGDSASVSSSIRSRSPSRRSTSVRTTGEPSQNSNPVSSKRIIPAALVKAQNAWLSLMNSAAKKRKVWHRKARNRNRSGSTTSNLHLPTGCSSMDRQITSDKASTSVTPDGVPITPKEVTEGAKGELSAIDKGVYDSSNKRRVPSWCDRILWKTTIKPAEDPEEPGPNTVRGLRQQPRRLSQVFAGLRKGSRDESPSPRRKSFDLFKTTSLESAPTVSTSIANEAVISHPTDLAGGASVRRQRSLPTSTVPMRPIIPRVPRRSESDGLQANEDKPDESSNTSPNTAFGAPKRWLLNLMSRDSSPGLAEQTAPLLSPRPRLPRKGDVTCVSYRTLDDQRMRILEGRSDHRPVIGSYAVYL
ncbi:hypothetical protein M422DRAFT_202876 [Sphaerobolus stellatus SS14]|nr:hypothetical protein M422DRAFT_202876 [Sphaerobolus stellatus SS14]